MPSRPTEPSLRHRSGGNSFVRSISAARGAISLAAKSRTVSRSMAMVSPWSKPRKLIAQPKNQGPTTFSAWFCPCSFGVIRSTGEHHEGLLHGGDVLAILSVHLRARHGEGAAGFHHLAARSERRGGRSKDVHLVFDGDERAVRRHQRIRGIAAGGVGNHADDAAV